MVVHVKVNVRMFGCYRFAVFKGLAKMTFQLNATKAAGAKVILKINIWFQSV